MREFGDELDVENKEGRGAMSYFEAQVSATSQIVGHLPRRGTKSVAAGKNRVCTVLEISQVFLMANRVEKRQPREVI